ncbi:DUF4132 domain-containing protein [Virgisporangium ochraceum]|uniref:DUF4132 domain-containing protein n=1 Tax=Virgisporangium ochraceum TaxID=65505 RepID=A0A8J3ZSX0_9ACTN|nr:DUF4132 domain-containing protein [Virgisporangium ochraceum]GIJ66920.1 hypothetical protein Voc01_018370 [Virgisporangium ochraceum]
MGWLSAVEGYEVALVGGKVASRRVGGRPLKTVPKPVREHDTTLGLVQTQEWLARHDLACRAEVEKWLIRSLPVPVAVLTAVWPDPSWRAPLTDVIVAPIDDSSGDGGAWQLDDAGFLRDADPARGLGVVNLDGDSMWLDPRRVALPHPVVLEELDDLREFATELGLSQGTPQLHREVWVKPAGKEARDAELSRYAGGRYEELRHLTARAGTLGYRVRGGSAVCQVWERGGQVVASVWLGDYDPWSETETGPLEFTTAAGGALPLDDVGPVAWSEGMRMAAALYAGRSLSQEEQS